MKARTTKALREINTSRRFGLTGTALQNNLLEFWSILDWYITKLSLISLVLMPDLKYLKYSYHCYLTNLPC